MENISVDSFKKTQKLALIKILKEYLSLLCLQTTLKNDFLTPIISKCMEDPASFLVVNKGEELAGFTCTEYSEWDSRHFGFEIAKINVIAFRKLQSKQMLKPRLRLISEVVKVASKKGFKCIICRVNTVDICTVHVLESEKFQLMDILVTFGLELRNRQQKNFEKKTNENIIIRPFKSTDITNLKEIAQTSFYTDHFHMDPHFPKEKVDDLYAEWIYNCCNKSSANTVLVAQYNRKTIGFIACKVNTPHNYGVIELVAVRQDVQRVGVGSNLLEKALNWFNKRVNKVYVGTQITNIPAIGLYQRAGFKFLKSEATFHRWSE